MQLLKGVTEWGLEWRIFEHLFGVYLHDVLGFSLFAFLDEILRISFEYIFASVSDYRCVFQICAFFSVCAMFAGFLLYCCSVCGALELLELRISAVSY